LKGFKIAISANEALFDFDSTWKTVAEEYLERELQIKSHHYNLMARYQMTDAEYHSCWQIFNERDAWRDCSVFPEALEQVLQWQREGHALTVISTDNQHPHELRRAAMDALGLDNITLITVGARGSKFKILKTIKPKVYVDEIWKHCREAVDAGVPHVFRVAGGHDGGEGAMQDIQVIRNIREIENDACFTD